MQDKNKLDNMAERYKEEMMRLYKSKRTETPIVNKKNDDVPASKEQPTTQTVTVPQNEVTEQHMNPPMPQIPMDYGKGVEEAVTVKVTNKFPSAEEIMQAETAVQTIATITTDPRFEPADDLPHNQGNYNYDAPEPLEDLEDYVEDIIPDIDYPDEDTDFEDLFDDDDDRSNAPDMKGTGYLQVEVTTGDGAVPVPKAAVIVTQELGGQSYLVTMKLTDRSGATDIIP
ncbi:MAG: hypothetical protein J6A05_05610, partial [Oscillospiraceae bacterium]|nr:hypothetical protein [Oscillospiraceae bacterium]